MTEAIPEFTVVAGGTAPAGFSLRLRPATSADEALLLQTFAESHCAGFELMGLEPAALAGLIRMQFQARQSQYRMHPGAADYLICHDQNPLGNCWLAESATQLRVLDIAVLVEHRRRGVASAVLGELCARAAAAAKPVRLSVWHANAAALALYRELGFIPDPLDSSGEQGESGNGYLELSYFGPDATAAAARQRAGVR